MRTGRRPRGDGQRALRAIPLFQRCTDAELLRVEKLVDQIDVAAGEVITSERDAPAESYVIVSGEASLVVRERSVDRLAAGDVFGEIASLWSGWPPAATVTAITPLRVLVLERRDLAELVAIPGVALQLATQAVSHLGAHRRSPCS